jgi:hypothetical protein
LALTIKKLPKLTLVDEANLENQDTAPEPEYYDDDDVEPEEPSSVTTPEPEYYDDDAEPEEPSAVTTPEPKMPKTELLPNREQANSSFRAAVATLTLSLATTIIVVVSICLGLLCSGKFCNKQVRFYKHLIRSKQIYLECTAVSLYHNDINKT